MEGCNSVTCQLHMLKLGKLLAKHFWFLRDVRTGTVIIDGLGKHTARGVGFRALLLPVRKDEERSKCVTIC